MKKNDRLAAETDDSSLISWDQLFPEDVAEDVLRAGGADPMAQKEEKAAPVKDQAYWTQVFNEMNFPGMDLMAVNYFNLGAKDILEQHIKLKRVIREFLILLTYNNITDLRSAGISEEGIFYMKKGKLPENYAVHLKYPIEYGGAVDFNNMVLIQEKPFHKLIHDYIDQQSISEKGHEFPKLLYVPVPPGKIYVPFGGFTGSGGKNKQDRSTVAGFSKAALDKITLRNMPGR